MGAAVVQGRAMMQTAVLIVAIVASLLTGWYITDTRYRARIRDLENLAADQRRRIINLTRDEHGA